MDAIFLFSYAFGLYASGLIGDIFDASRVHSVGLFSTGIIFIIFASLIPSFHFHSLPLFYFLWILNGLFQSLGWPSAVKLVANWFNSDHNGALFGIWASNQCVGNIIGAAYVSFVHVNDYHIQYMFYLPSIQAIIVALLVCIFVKTNPPNIGIAHSDTNSQDIEMEMVDIHQTEQRNNRQNSDHYAQLDDDSLISNESHLDIDMHNTIRPMNEMFEQENKPKLSFCEILRIPNLITYSLCFACLKSVNYTMFFWLPYFENNHFNEADADYLEIYYS